MGGWATSLIDEQRARLVDYIHASNATLGALIEVDIARGVALQRRYQKEGADSLVGIPLAIKDNIAVEGFQLSCGSRILEKLRAPYSATAVLRLLQAGALPIAKCNLDEFGMGSDSQHSCYGPVKNPWHEDYVPGGSSGGSAVAVAAGMVPLALGSDTGGSVRQPAAFCGIYGLKPTYGAISRFGLVAYASSLETIGILAEDIALLRCCYQAMRGPDSFDQTTVTAPAAPPHNPATCQIGYLAEPEGLEESVALEYRRSVEALQELGYTTKPITLPHLRYIAPAYYTIATAEASANLARYDGIRYGYQPTDAESAEELTKRARSEGLGDEVQLRILLGNYVLREGFQERYYLRAQYIRRALRRKIERLFRDIETLLLPVFPTPPFRRGERGMSTFQQKQADCYTSLANLTGQPALALPVTVHAGLPLGVQLLGREHSEERLMDIAQRYRRYYSPPRPPRYPGVIS